MAKCNSDPVIVSSCWLLRTFQLFVKVQVISYLIPERQFVNRYTSTLLLYFFLPKSSQPFPWPAAPWQCPSPPAIRYWDGPIPTQGVISLANKPSRCLTSSHGDGFPWQFNSAQNQPRSSTLSQWSNSIMFPSLLSLLYPSSYPLIFPLIPRKPPPSTAVLLADLQALHLFAPALQLCTAHVDHLLQHGGLGRSKGDFSNKKQAIWNVRTHQNPRAILRNCWFWWFLELHFVLVKIQNEADPRIDHSSFTQE